MGQTDILREMDMLWYCHRAMMKIAPSTSPNGNLFRTAPTPIWTKLAPSIRSKRRWTKWKFSGHLSFFSIFSPRGIISNFIAICLSTISIYYIILQYFPSVFCYHVFHKSRAKPHHLWPVASAPWPLFDLPIWSDCLPTCLPTCLPPAQYVQELPSLLFLQIL